MSSEADKFDLTPEEFADSFKAHPGAVLLDVRTEEEFESGHLPGALNINITGHEFHEQAETLDPEITYFIYCRSGARSGTACRYLHSKGFADVYNLKGGIIAWNGEVVQ